MTMTSLGGGHQRFIQRVRRHAAASVLFGGSPAADAAPLPPMPTAAPPGVVQAMMWPASAGPATEADAWSSVEPGWSDEDRLTAAIDQAEAGSVTPRPAERPTPSNVPHTQRATQSPARPTPATTLLTASTRPTPAPALTPAAPIDPGEAGVVTPRPAATRPAERPTPPNVPHIQRAAQPSAGPALAAAPQRPVPSPMPAPVSTPSDDQPAPVDEEEDPIWQRLQSIMRRHKQQETPPPASSQPGESTPPSQPLQRAVSGEQPAPAVTRAESAAGPPDPAATNQLAAEWREVVEPPPAPPPIIQRAAVYDSDQTGSFQPPTVEPAPPPSPTVQRAEVSDSDQTGASRPTPAEPVPAPPPTLQRAAAYQDDPTGTPRPTAAEQAPASPSAVQRSVSNDQPIVAAAVGTPRLPAAEPATDTGLTSAPAVQRAIAATEMPLAQAAPAASDPAAAQASRPPAAEPTADASSNLAADVQRAVAAVESPRIQRAMATDSSPNRAFQPPSSEAARPATQFDITNTSGLVDSVTQPDDEPGLDDEPLPLHAVWPVEAIGPMNTTQPAEAPSAIPPSPLRPPAPEDEAIQRALLGVAAGQPTRSAVELVLPRRARPVNAAELPARPTVSRQAHPDVAPAQKPADRAALSNRSATGGANAGDMIATEIGPLPADLWRTLGENPPAADPVLPAPVQLMPAEPSPERTKDDLNVEAAIRAAEAPAARAGTRLSSGPRPSATPPPAAAPRQTTAQRSTAAPQPTMAQRFPAGISTDSPAGATTEMRSAAMTRPAAPPQASSGSTSASQPVMAGSPPTARPMMPNRAAAEPLANDAEHPTTGEVTNSPLTVQRAILPDAPPAVEWSASPARPAAVAEAPPLAVQRQEEHAAPSTADDLASPAAGPAAGEASEVDVDELARRVYSEVKRRLALEWERARGRLG